MVLPLQIPVLAPGGPAAHLCLVVLLPEKWTSFRADNWKRGIQLAGVLVVLLQFALFLRGDVQSYTGRLHRADNHPRILFYDQAVDALAPLADRQNYVYYDYRLYVPETPGWRTETSYELLDYGYIQERNFDVLLLLQQRINDYLNPNAAGIDPVAFARSQEFYRDADSGAIQGYRLVYRDATALVYVRDDLVRAEFQP